VARPAWPIPTPEPTRLRVGPAVAIPPKGELAISTASPTSRSRTVTILLIVGIIATALNLRIVINALALVLDEIRDSTGISSSAAGLLSTLPVLCFGIIAPLAPKLARKIGLDQALWLAMIALAVGILSRLIASTTMLFVGTAIIGMAIGIANVLLPASLKRDFPTQTGLMTGVLTMTMSLSGTIGVGLTVPVQDLTGFSWRGTLAVWTIPAIVALVALMPRFFLADVRHAVAPATGAHRPINLWRNRLAWEVTLVMGLQAFVFYSIATWFPTLMLDHGIEKGEAGLYLSIANLAGFVSSFIVPVVASRRHDQRAALLVSMVLIASAIVALIVAPTTLVWLTMTIFGLGVGGALSLAVAFFSLRSPDLDHAAQLSGMAQSVGYCLAATGPFLIGALHDTVGGWTVPLIVILIAIAIMTVAGYGAAQNRQVVSA